MATIGLGTNDSCRLMDGSQRVEYWADWILGFWNRRFGQLVSDRCLSAYGIWQGLTKGLTLGQSSRHWVSE